MSKDRVTRILKVAVWDLISSVYNEIGIPIPTTNELMSMVDGDKATWDVFAKGICAGVNQCEKDATKQRLMRYKPQNVSELSAFVAAIRPGFKSNLEQFLSRQHFDYGIPVFDELIQTKWMPNSYLLYQENIMTALAFAGFPATECYAVLKHISKKHPDKIAEIKPRFISGFVDGLGGGEEAQANAEKIWQIISDASSYSFNASHSTAVAFDALYIAWAKAHYPLQTYRAMLEIYSKKGDKARLNLIKGEMFSGSGVMLEQCRFGRDNTDYGIDEENGVIRDCLISIPYINKTVSRELLSAYRNFNSWVECLVALDNTSLNKRQMETLIRLNYFREFGTINRLLNIYEEFKTGKCKYQSSYSDKTKETRLALLTELERTTENEPEEQNVYTLAQNQARLLGTVLGTYDVNSRYYIVTDIDPTYSPKLTLYSLARGRSGVMKMKKDAFELSNIAIGDVIDTGDREKGDWQIRPKYRYNGKGSKPVEIPNTKELWLINLKIIRKAPTVKEENE